MMWLEAGVGLDASGASALRGVALRTRAPDQLCKGESPTRSCPQGVAALARRQQRGEGFFWLLPGGRQADGVLGRGFAYSGSATCTPASERGRLALKACRAISRAVLLFGAAAQAEALSICK
mmetsp:Transcript_59387/g.184093  ORF Transcript_59387/g.184093 Transcript_59387/m.184093 type:complete len:122 (+) Transcript_59387:1129-1494(+)